MYWYFIDRFTKLHCNFSIWQIEYWQCDYHIKLKMLRNLTDWQKFIDFIDTLIKALVFYNIKFLKLLTYFVECNKEILDNPHNFFIIRIVKIISQFLQFVCCSQHATNVCLGLYIKKRSFLFVTRSAAPNCCCQNVAQFLSSGANSWRHRHGQPLSGSSWVFCCHHLWVSYFKCKNIFC